MLQNEECWATVPVLHVLPIRSVLLIFKWVYEPDGTQILLSIFRELTGRDLFKGVIV